MDVFKNFCLCTSVTFWWWSPKCSKKSVSAVFRCPTLPVGSICRLPAATSYLYHATRRAFSTHLDSWPGTRYPTVCVWSNTFLSQFLAWSKTLFQSTSVHSEMCTRGFPIMCYINWQLTMTWILERKNRIKVFWQNDRDLQVGRVQETESCNEWSGSSTGSEEHSTFNSHRGQSCHHFTVACQQLVWPRSHDIRHQPQYAVVTGDQ